MNAPRTKDPMEKYGEILIKGLQKAAASAGAEVIKDLETELRGGRTVLEEIAACTCTPVYVRDPDGDETEVHAKSCPTRRR